MSKSLRSRMGAAVRRSSSVFALANARPTTPSRSSSEIDATSVRSTSRLDVSTNLSTPPDTSGRKVVSPIAESPIIPPSTEPERISGDGQPSAEVAPKTKEPANSQTAEQDPITNSDTRSVHSRVVDSSKPVTVGMFTDEPDSLSMYSKNDREPRRPIADAHTERENEGVPMSLPNPHSPPPGAFTDYLTELPPALVAKAPTYGASEEEPRAPTPPPVEHVDIPRTYTPPPVEPAAAPRAVTPQPTQIPRAVTPQPVESAAIPRALTPQPVEHVIPRAVTPQPIEHVIPRAVTPQPVENAIPRAVTPQPVERVIPRAVTPQPVERVVPRAITPQPVEHVIPRAVTPQPTERAVILPVPQVEVTDASPTHLHESPRSFSYLHLPKPEVKSTTPTEVQFRHSVEDNVWGTTATDHAEGHEQQGGPPHSVNGIPIIPGVENNASFENGHGHTKAPHTIEERHDRGFYQQPVSILPVPEPAQYPGPNTYEHPPFWNPVSAKPSHMSLRQPGNNQVRQNESSEAHTLYDDPFADPIVPPVATVANAQASIMPHPEIHTGKPSGYVASSQSLVASERQNNERMPLLPNRISPQPSSYSYLHNAAAESPVAPPNTSANKLQQLGWFEYALPDQTRYYVHATYRIVTDLNLRDDRSLQAVADHLELGADFQGGGFERRKEVEMWLRNVSSSPDDVLLVRSWVDHSKKRVSVIPPHVNEDDSSGSTPELERDDQLDAGYRYWSFIESHPAHMALPLTATREASEALTWSYTDQLLPSDNADASPFSINECQELMGLLRSFEGSPDTTGPSPVKTRVIARIHVRVAQWQQAHFRPNKPLPEDVTPNYRIKKQAGFRRRLTDTMISCLCFGIPYLLFHRSHRRIDEEAGLLRLPSTGPVLIVGACTCLVAAVVLSASVTFLSLPGMDSFARIAAVVSILFSTSSMASSILALFRYKAEVDRALVITRQIIGEGMLVDYRRSVAMSLPVVFLVYALIGFVTGIVLYSFRGVEATNPLEIVRPFDQYTRWVTVGVLGALAGLLSTVVVSVGRH